MVRHIDKKTLALINQLNTRDKAGALNDIDKQWFQRIISGEITIQDIQAEKDKCRAD